MHEDNKTNQSALELRLKQVTRYVSLGLLGVLALCALLFMYIGSVKQNEKAAISNSQVQADQTKDSTFCSIYPDDEICVLSRKIAADPTQVVVPKDGINGLNGEKGDQGERGRGVTAFDVSDDGELIITFSDGQSQNAGKVVGKDGIDGVNGNNGRGILSAGLDQGNLIIRYTDGTTENVGMVVGPAGIDGNNGVDGQPGTNGTNGINGEKGDPGLNGISVIDLQVDNDGYVQVYYSDGQIKPAGRIITSSISSMSCDTSSDLLSIFMTDGSSVSATVDCSPDSPFIPAPAQPAPQPTP